MSTPTVTGTDVEAGHAQRRQVLAICCLCLVMVVMAVSSLNIAIPELQRGLRSTATQLLWIVDAYALVFAGLLLPAGALGDRFGRKGALLAGLGLFGMGTLFSGLSGSASQVIAGRAVMGVGAAFVMPATLSIVTTVFPPSERARAIAVWAGFAGAGGALGPVTSGLVLKAWDWSAVFFITVPVVVVAAGLVAWKVPSSRDPEHTRLDPIGAGLSVLALFALLFGTIEGPEQGWTSPGVVGAYAAAVVLFAGFVRWELRTTHPMLDPRLFRVRAFTVGSATITLVFFVTFGMFFLVSQYLQYVLAYSPLVAGAAMLPSGLTMIAVAPRGPAVAARIGAERTIALGLGASAVGFGILARLGPDGPYVWVAVALVLMAGGSALAMPPSTGAIVGSLPPAKAGVGSAVNDVTRELGGALGIAVLGSIASARYRNEIRPTADGLPAEIGVAVEESVGRAVAVGGATPAGQGSSIVDAAQDAFTNATGTAFLVAALLMAFGSAAYWRMCRGRLTRTELDAAAESAPGGTALAATVPCSR